MTKVTNWIRGVSLAAACFSLALTMPALGWGQNASGPASGSAAAEKPAQGHPAETLYLQLGSVGLDRSRVFKVREVSLDRAALHISLEDGTIAFTEDVAGRVTGAFFEGEGEVLLSPPNQVERASMALFTGAAILEERFFTAYFRFNDDTFAQLQPSLRPAGNAQEFFTQWNDAARNLAQTDALRLLLSFSRLLPDAGGGQTLAAASRPGADDDRMLHARVQGRTLGIFDLYFDSNATEQIWAGQLKTAEGASYYDVWASFSPNQPGSRPRPPGGITGEETRPDPISVSHYRIQAEVRPPTELTAQAALQVDVRRGGQRAVLFELSRFLQVKQVEADGHPVEFIHNQALEGTQLARRGNDLVAVVFPHALRAGQKLELRFVYGGQVLSEAGGGLLYVGARGTWYPNRGLAMSNFDLEFHYPPGWTLLATGKRTDVPASGVAGVSGVSAVPPDTEQVSRWVSERPIPLAGFNLGKYARVEARAGDVAVEVYAAAGVERTFPRSTDQTIAPGPLVHSGLVPTSPPQIMLPAPPSPAKNAQPVADASARAIDFFSRRFGPYPYSSLALTQMPGELSQGWPGLIFLSSFSFLTPVEKSQIHMGPVDKTVSEKVIAHETAHQWWGDLVLWNSYRDQWIVEGLANYSSLMILESENPSQFRAVMESYREKLLQKNKQGVPLMDAGPVTLGARLSSSHFAGGYEAISYGRGTWLFHMLRYMMRDAERKTEPRARSSEALVDEPLVRALRRMREQYQGRPISTRQLLSVFEEELPASLWYEGRKSLDWFMQGWVNGTAIPRLELHGMKFADKSGATTVSGTILQTSAPNDLVTSVPVYAVAAGKIVLLGRVFADGPETTFHLTAPTGTRKVVLDPNRTLLAQVR